jgi:hypothetical protein
MDGSLLGLIALYMGAGLGVFQPLSDGGEMIVLNVPLNVGRPGPAWACVPLEFTFDEGGALVSLDPLAASCRRTARMLTPRKPA